MRRRSSRTPSARTRTKNKVAVRLPHRFAHATRRQCRFHIFRAAAAGRLAGCAGSTCCRAKQENLVLYSPTCPTINWSRAGLSMYPSVAGRKSDSSRIVVIARFDKEILCRESNEESPESQWLFGAVWGAAAVRLPPFAPAYSPRKTWQSQYVPAKRTYATPPTPFSASFRPPVGIET